MPYDPVTSRQRSTGLVDVLDRVLDKGLVIAGDIKISLAEVELLTIRIRLLVCSLDKAREIGLDWWKHDLNLTVEGSRALIERRDLEMEVRDLKRQLARRTAVRRVRGGRSR